MQNEKKRYRELEKYLEQKTKEIYKAFHLKKKDYLFYLVKGGMFYSVMLSMNQDCLQADFCAKPFWLDDLLWEILEMEDNAKAPVSLRGIGAFTIQSKIREKTYAASDTAQIDEIVERVFAELVELSESYGEEAFEAECKSIAYQQEVIEVIVLIHSGEYEKALDLCQRKKIGYFGDVDRGFSELAADYLRKMYAAHSS